MPLPAEGLTPQSTPEEIQAAISDSIKQCMDEGSREQDQCVAMAYSMARRATGKPIGRKSQRSKKLAAGP